LIKYQIISPVDETSISHPDSLMAKWTINYIVRE